MQISNATNNYGSAALRKGMEYVRLEVSSGEDQFKFVCLQRGICYPRRCDNVWIRT